LYYDPASAAGRTVRPLVRQEVFRQSTARLLKQNYKTTERKVIRKAQLQKVKASLDHKTEKLGLLTIAKEKAQMDNIVFGSQAEMFIEL
jgi:hypothetical protein